MTAWPKDVRPYWSTQLFDHRTVPVKLTARHRTKGGGVSGGALR